MSHFLTACVAAILSVCCLQSRAVAAPPLEAYGSLPEVEEMVLSPAGDRFAAVTTLRNDRVIIVFDSDLNLIKSLAVGDIKIRSIEFASEDMLLVRRSLTQDLGYGFAQDKVELYQAILVPLSTDSISVVFADRADVVNATFGYHGTRIVDGQPKAYFGALKLRKGNFGEGYVFDHGRPSLFVVDLLTNRSKPVDGPATEGSRRDWMIGPDGQVLARLDISETDGNWTLRNRQDKVIARGRSLNGQVGLLSAGQTSATVIYSVRNPATQDYDWFEIALDGTGTPNAFLPDLDISGLIRDPITGLLVGYRERDAEPTYFDPAQSKRAAAIRKAFVDRNPRIIETTAGLAKALVETNGNSDSGSYYIVDLAALRANPVGQARSSIAPEDVGPISTVRYAAADGLELDGILTLPPGREAKGLPLVVLPHGGPASHDTAQFDWWAQAFASRGYAVFQPNFRGSTGRGSAFLRMGYGEWGGKMQTDISDGVAKLAVDGTIDPKRSCIVGASYGGYAALAGVTLQQGLYRCAVSVAGVADLMLMTNIERRESGDTRTVRKSLELQLGPRSNFRALSPRFNADKADAPILLIHGKEDTVVAFTQSEKMADALKDAGKPYEFVVLPGEDHWLSLGSTRLQMLKAAVSFVEKHNPPD